MTIPMLQGLGDQLGPVIGELTDQIGTLIDPNAKFNHAMKLAFLQNPEMMQKFVDIEKANPGTLKAFGFNDAGTDLLSGMRESIPALRDRILAPEVAAQLQTPGPTRTAAATRIATGGMTPGEVAGDDFSAWFTKEGRKLLDSDPSLFVRAARAKFGTGTALDNKMEDASIAGYEAAKDLMQLPPMEQVKAVVRGDVTTQQLAGMLTNPGQQAAFGAAMQLYQQERQRQMNMFVAQYRHKSDDPLARARLGAAIDAWESAGRKGTMAGWYNMIFPKNTGDFGASAPDDAQVIADAQKNQSNRIRQQQIQTTWKTVEPMIAAVHKGGSESEQLRRIGDINTALEADGSDWEAFWDTDWINELMFRNKRTHEVTRDATVLTSPVSVTDVQTEDQLFGGRMTPGDLQTVSRLKGMQLTDEQKKRAVANWNRQYPNDSAYVSFLSRQAGF